LLSQLDKNTQEIRYWHLINNIYSGDEDTYEENIDIDTIWKVPYEAIKECLKPIVIIFNATFGLGATLAFIDWYYINQSNYQHEYQISEIKYKLLKMVVREELLGKRFCYCVISLKESGFLDSNQTEQTDFMIKKAREFIVKIKNKDKELPKTRRGEQLKLIEERETSECLLLSEKLGYTIISL